MDFKLKDGTLAFIDEADFHIYENSKWSLSDNRGYKYLIRRDIREGKPKTICLHRIILGVTDPKIFIDHINGNGLDNRRQNLRIATSSQNFMNRKKHKNYKYSKYKGVSWDKENKKWRVSIQLNKKRYRLGRFKSEIDAAGAYDNKARELFGDFARLNFKKSSNLDGAS